MSRPSIFDIQMDIAKIWARRSTCTSRAQVGAVLVNSENRVVAAGYNGAPSGVPHCDDVGCDYDEGGHCLTAIHAEANAILQCARSGVSTVGLFIVTTHFPCTHCCNLIIQAGIKKVIYEIPYGSERNWKRTLRKFELSGVTIERYDDL